MILFLLCLGCEVFVFDCLLSHSKLLFVFYHFKFSGINIAIISNALANINNISITIYLICYVSAQHESNNCIQHFIPFCANICVDAEAKNVPREMLKQ